MIFGKNINRYYLKYWYLYIVGILALLCVDFFDSLLPPRIIAGIIGELKNGTMTQQYLNERIVQLLLIMVISFICRFLWRFVFFSISHKVGKDLRYRMFKNSLTFSQTFYSDNKVGGLMSYYINDIDSVTESFGWGVMMVFDVLSLVPMILIRMFLINWSITVLSLIPLLMIAVGSTVVGAFMEKRYKIRQDNFEYLSDFTQESISGIRVVKAFVREDKEFDTFKIKNRNNEKVNMDYIRLSVLFNNLVELFIWIVYFLIIIVGSYIVLEVPETPLEVENLTELIAYFDTLLWPMFAIGEIINIRSRGKASLKRVDEILNNKSDLIEAKNPIKVDNIKGDISFNHLSFKFPNTDQFALNDVTFDIKAGEFIGVIGRTGSSKSTLVNLLLRLYNVEKDEILIDGNDIMNYSISDIRKNIGYVPQDNFLYSTSIDSNIAFSDRSINIEKVKKNARIAGVHEDIMMFPHTYETILGERGVSVSGGQKQRISIARALYKDPNILILDDALSAVDTKTESEILKFLKEERKGRTTILIAHRISSIKDADKILVLDTGGVVSGFDTHEALLKNNEIYRDTYNLQKLEEEGGISRV